MWLTDLAKLADPKYGLRVEFVSGWRTRGASGGDSMRAVLGVLWHHTAGPRSGNYPSRNVLTNGRPGLTGPLCHVGLRRDGVVVVHGAGKANHAGTGKVSGVVRNGGNTRLVGVEMESSGVRPWDWTSAQLDTMPKLGAAFNDIFRLDSDEHWAHYEYSDGGKIDPAGLPGAMPGLRSRIAAASGQTHHDPSRPWRSSSRVAGMAADQVRAIQDVVGTTRDGVYGDQTGAAVAALQEALELTPDGVWGPSTEAAVSKLEDKIDRLIAFGEQNQWRLDRLPSEVWNHKMTLKGSDFEGKISTPGTKFIWLDHERETGEARILSAISTLASAVEGLTERVAAIEDRGPKGEG